MLDLETFLSAKELCDKYPVAFLDPLRAWLRYLDAWRDDPQKLPPLHWRFAKEEGIRCPVRIYREVAVLRCILEGRFNSPFCQMVYRQNKPHFQELLTLATTTTTTTTTTSLANS